MTTLDPGASEVFTQGFTFRPSARDEVGNNEVSLFSYMDALEGAYTDYCRLADQTTSFDDSFDYLVYHTPFAGMAFKAHRALTNLSGIKPKA